MLLLLSSADFRLFAEPCAVALRKDSILGGAAFNPRDGFGPGAQLECYCGLGEVQCEAPGTQVVG